jgi:hypothetical protein
MERFITIPGKLMFDQYRKSLKFTIFNCRKPDEIEPPVEPAKLFRVSRIKPVKGNPHWERRILREIGLMEVSKSECCVDCI